MVRFLGLDLPKSEVDTEIKLNKTRVECRSSIKAAFSMFQRAMTKASPLHEPQEDFGVGRGESP